MVSSITGISPTCSILWQSRPWIIHVALTMLNVNFNKSQYYIVSSSVQRCNSGLGHSTVIPSHALLNEVKRIHISPPAPFEHDLSVFASRELLQPCSSIAPWPHSNYGPITARLVVRVAISTSQHGCCAVAGTRCATMLQSASRGLQGT